MMTELILKRCVCADRLPSTTNPEFYRECQTCCKVTRIHGDSDVLADFFLLTILVFHLAGMETGIEGGTSSFNILWTCGERGTLNGK